MGALRLGWGVGAIDLDGSIIASKKRRSLAGRLLVRHFGGKRMTVPTLKRELDEGVQVERKAPTESMMERQCGAFELQHELI